MQNEFPFTPVDRCRRCRLYRPLTHFPWEDKGLFMREQSRYCHDCYDIHHRERDAARWKIARACGLELMGLIGVILLAKLAGPVWWWLLIPLGVWTGVKTARYLRRLGASVLAGAEREMEEAYLRGLERGERKWRAELRAELETRGLPISGAIGEFLNGGMELDDLPEEDGDLMFPVVRAVLKRHGVEV